MSALTHQERAERAAYRVLRRFITPHATAAIAREMYPRELVEAARKVAERPPTRDELDALRLALSLYPEPEEETDRE